MLLKMYVLQFAFWGKTFLLRYFLKRISWPEMTDIIDILIRCKFAYHVEFGFICVYSIILRDVVNRKLSKVGHLQLALVVGSKTKSIRCTIGLDLLNIHPPF